MTLPAWLRPWWRYFKLVHRFLTRTSGFGFRLISPLVGRRGLPRSAAATSAQAAQRSGVTLHEGAPEVTLTRSETVGSPADHPVFAGARTATIPAAYCLEVQGGMVSGRHGAVITPGKVLDHQTSPYFGVTDWREHPLFLRPTLGSLEHLPGNTLTLTARGTDSNYYHFMYDAIGRLGVFEETCPGTPINTVVVPHQTRYQRQLLELVGLTGPFVQPRVGITVVADTLWAPSHPNWALDAPPSTVSWLRERLLAPNREAASSRLYLTRGTAPNTRRYIEEAALLPHLEKRGFRCVDPGQFSVREQIDLFSTAEVIVAPHGAALTNLTFAPPGVKVLEMFAASYVHLGLWAIGQAIEADYRYLVADPSREPTHNSGVLDDVSIPVAEVLDALDDLLG
ncbi:hypothetical protein GCM10027020_36190 [Nocardioides salsibiostraticola]